MNRVANNICEAEKAIGLDSFIVDTDKPETWKEVKSDINVVHTHLSPEKTFSDAPVVWIPHGTPEVMFLSAYEQAIINGQYGHGDGWMLAQFWLRRSDAIITFWPRHAAIWKSMCDRKTTVHCMPEGLDPSFWHPIESAGRFAGKPSLLTAENSYTIKWPLDLFIAWPWVYQREGLYDARLHAIYLPKDQHRFYFPLVNANGASFGGYLSATVLGKEELRNAFCSVDYYIGLVRYGDFNTLALEARACGAKIISYRGNPYASYWIDEGDQRVMAEQLADILLGKVEERKEIAVVAPIESMVRAFEEIYKGLL
jgi:hypothetical protein